MVVSHERSGTHFLMRTLAINFGYVAEPWYNLDFELGIPFHSPLDLWLYFVRHMHNVPMLNIVKSHHQVGFFAPFLDYLLQQFHIFYIYRDPRQVMLSYWLYCRLHAWDEGPRAADVGEFMRAAPRGGMMRYQKEQAPTILERWQHHVDGWTDAAMRDRTGRLVIVRYDDLDRRFAGTVRDIARRVGLPSPDHPSRPSPACCPTEGRRPRLRRGEEAYLRAAIGGTLARLGF
jgi:hypothetical protein